MDTREEVSEVTFKLIANLGNIIDPNVIGIQYTGDGVVPSMDNGSEVKVVSVGVALLQPSCFGIVSP